MTRRVPVLLGVLASALVFSPSVGSAALPKAPVITSISPKKLNVGDTLTIRGRYFLPGNFRNTVAFQKPRAQAVFLKADKATKTTIKIKLTSKLMPFLSQRGGRRSPRASASGSWPSASGPPSRPSPCPRPSAPVRVPSPAIAPTATTTATPNSAETDDDNDLLSDTTEAKYRLDSCNAGHRR